MSVSLISMSVSPLQSCKFFSTIFLDFIYMRYNMVFIFLFLIHFTLYNMFPVHPPHQSWLKCIPFYGRVIFHCVYVPFICRWTFRLGYMYYFEFVFSFFLNIYQFYGIAGLKPNIQKTNFMAFSPITSWQINGETMETVTHFLFLSSKITADSNCSHEIKRH